MPARNAGTTADGGNSAEREDATIAVVSTKMRDCEMRSRARPPRRSRHPEIAPGVSISRPARVGHAAPDACRIRDRGNETSLLGLSKNPALALAWTPGHPSRDVFRPAVSKASDYDSTVSTTANFCPTVLGTAMTTLSILRRPRSSIRTALSHPLRLDGAHEAMRVDDFALFGTSTCLWACRSHVAADVYSIPMDRCD